MDQALGSLSSGGQFCSHLLGCNESRNLCDILRIFSSSSAFPSLSSDLAAVYNS